MKTKRNRRMLTSGQMMPRYYDYAKKVNDVWVYCVYDVDRRMIVSEHDSADAAHAASKKRNSEGN